MINNEISILIGGIILVVLYVFIPENRIVKKIKNIITKIESYRIYYIFKVRAIYLAGRLTLAIIANYGAYTTYNIMSTTIYPQDQIESAKIVMFVLEQMGWIIALYIYYDIFSTAYSICNDLIEIKNKFSKK